jgi:hypothetical protein
MAQIKIYEAKEAANSWLPRGTSELLGASRGREQGSWYIVAHTAAEAVEIAQRAKIAFVDSPRHLRVWGRGNRAQQLQSHGYLATPGEVIAHLDNGGTTAVAKFTADGWMIIGQFEYDAQKREIVFTPEEF